MQYCGYPIHYDIRYSFRQFARILIYRHVRVLQKRVSTRSGDKSRTLHTSQLQPTAEPGVFVQPREDRFAGERRTHVTRTKSTAADGH